MQVPPSESLILVIDFDRILLLHHNAGRWFTLPLYSPNRYKWSNSLLSGHKLKTKKKLKIKVTSGNLSQKNS